MYVLPPYIVKLLTRQCNPKMRTPKTKLHKARFKSVLTTTDNRMGMVEGKFSPRGPEPVDLFCVLLSYQLKYVNGQYYVNDFSGAVVHLF